MPISVIQRTRAIRGFLPSFSGTDTASGIVTPYPPKSSGMSRAEIRPLREVASIVRHGEDRAWGCDSAQRMRAQWEQRRGSLGRERAGDQDGPAERPAQPFQPADQVDGGADRGEVQPVGRTD